MTLGVTVGKFHPLHRGHEHLIREARSRVDRLVVLVGEKPEHALPGDLRAGWIRALFPDVEVVVTPDDLPEAPEPWARRTLAVLGGRRPDLAFTSESYGEPWAAAMGARHVAIDPARGRFPCSGTALRADLAGRWDDLTGPARAHFARRVRVVGVESSGKTTLTQALAAAYGTVWVPEYGRYYWEGRRHTPNDWTSDEFEAIARGQAAAEDALARRARLVLFGDTDPLATLVWHRRYLGTESPAVAALADARRYDLTLLTAPDFGFVQDGTRDGEHVREAMHGWFREALEARGVRYVLLEGSPERRLAAARAAVEPLLRFAPIPLESTPGIATRQSR